MFLVYPKSEGGSPIDCSMDRSDFRPWTLSLSPSFFPSSGMAEAKNFELDVKYNPTIVGDSGLHSPGGTAMTAMAGAGRLSQFAHIAPFVLPDKDKATAMIHLYRAEVGRMVAYRSRLRCVGCGAFGQRRHIVIASILLICCRFSRSSLFLPLPSIPASRHFTSPARPGRRRRRHGMWPHALLLVAPAADWT